MSPTSSRPSTLWVPLRPLAARHRPRLLAHLLALDETDRYLRFGFVATDEQIGRYVQGLDFERDAIYGVFDRRLRLVAFAHLAFGTEGGATSAEFGVSVLPRLRGRGIGARLFDHGVLLARNRGVETLVVHALTENAAMLRIAAKAGARVERDGPDATARLRVPPETLASNLGEIVERQVGEADYQLKRGARQLDEWLSGN